MIKVKQNVLMSDYQIATGALFLKKIIVEEQPVSLADILLRRTGIGWDIDQGKSAVPGVATVMAELCGWDEQRKEKEIQLFHQHMKEIYQVQKYWGDSVCD